MFSGNLLDKNNTVLTSKRIVYALACESLVSLGKVAVRDGADAYIGYSREFQWIVDLTTTSSPDKDKNAAPFRKICFVLGKCLLSGLTVGESLKRTKEEYRALIRNYGNEDSYGDSPLIGLALTWNLSFLGMEGDSEAVF